MDFQPFISQVAATGIVNLVIFKLLNNEERKTYDLIKTQIHNLPTKFSPLSLITRSVLTL